MFAVVIFVSAILASFCAAKRPPCFYEKLGAGSYDTCYTVKFGCNYCYLDFDETASKLENGELCTRPEEDLEAEEQICRDFNTWVDCLKTNVGKKNDSEEVKAKKICKATANYTARGWGEHCSTEPVSPEVTSDSTLGTANTDPVSQSATVDTTLAPGTTEPVTQTGTSETTSGPISTVPVSQTGTSETTMAPGTTEPASQNPTSETSLGTVSTEPVSHSGSSESTSTPGTTEPATQNPTFETTLGTVSNEPVSHVVTSESTSMPTETVATTESLSTVPSQSPSPTQCAKDEHYEACAKGREIKCDDIRPGANVTKLIQGDCAFTGCMCNPGLVRENNNECVTLDKCQKTGPTTTEPVSQTPTSDTTSGPISTVPVSQHGTSEITLTPGTTEPASQRPTSETTLDTVSTEPVSQSGFSESTSTPGTTEPATQNPTSETTLAPGTTEPATQSPTSESTSTPSTTEPASQNPTSESTLTPGTTEPASHKPTSETTLGPSSTEPVSHEVTSESTSAPTETVTTTEQLSTVSSGSPTPTQCREDEHYEACGKHREIKCDDIRPNVNSSNAVRGDCVFIGCMCNPGLVRENNNECVGIEKCQETVRSTTEPVTQKATSESTLGPGTTEPVSQTVTSETTSSPGTTEPIKEFTLEPIPTLPASEKVSSEPSMERHIPQCPKDEHYEACYQWREIKCDDILDKLNGTKLRAFRSLTSDCAFIGCMCDAGLVRENNNECISVEKCRGTAR
ncbi:trypsin inhibitor like cysteine rich domain-containing protein [Ditylenchus destructor]|nr:trypsin inhibitor like cysteine rich domain-containing protein [Ditylenchus destructor]